MYEMLQEYQQSAWTKDKLKHEKGNISGLKKNARKREKPTRSVAPELQTKFMQL